MQWKEWEKVYPALVVSLEPIDNYGIYKNYHTAETIKDKMEETYEEYFLVVKYGEMFYIVTK